METYIKERPIQEFSADKLGMHIMDSSVEKRPVTVDDYCNFSIKCKNGAFAVGNKECLGKKELYYF